MKTIEVLALGETINCYKPSGNITIGVNDIYKYVATDYIVVVDPPNRFHEMDRFNIIVESTPLKFFSNHVWNVPNFELIELQSPRGCCKQLDGTKYCYSNNSAFVACVLAYKMGANKIIIHGADFTNHAHLSNEHSLKRVLNDYAALNSELNKRGVQLWVSSTKSALHKILPHL